jgi:addiction module HigA family antidote
MKNEKLHPIHPGEILREEFLKPMNITSENLAKKLKISTEIINNIIEQKQPITADIALRLARYFQMSPQFWLGLQIDYDLDLAEDDFGEQIEREVMVLTS